MTISTNTIITTERDSVEYRTPSPFGVIVVKVIIIGPDPRICVSVDKPTSRGIPNSQPLSMTVGELLSYVKDAKERLL